MSANPALGYLFLGPRKMSWSEGMHKQLFLFRVFANLFASFLPYYLANNNRRKQATPKPEDQKEQQITEMQKSTQSVHQENLPGKI